MIVALYFWRIRPAAVPLALLRMGIDRIPLKKLKAKSEISFFKLLGTGKGKSFTPKDADVTRWGLLVCLQESQLEKFDNSAIVNNWRKFALSEARSILKPISSHGSWQGENPFSDSEDSQPTEWNGAVAAITRARISNKESLKFWRAVPPVTASLHRSPGLEFAIGIGEAPIGLQGTFSIWHSSQDLRKFAFEESEHIGAIKATQIHHWYSEELFARLALVNQRGDLKGQ